MPSEAEQLYQYRAILESAVDYAIIALDPDGHITSWNEGARRVLGWNKEEMLGRSAGIIFTEADQAAEIPEREMRDAVTHGRGLDERWHVRKDGSQFWASGEMMPLRDGEGRAIGFLKILRDKTRDRLADEERLRAEKSVQESEARLRLAIEAGRMAIWDVDVTTDTLSASPELNRILGFPEAAAPTLAEIRARYYPGEAQKLQAATRAALERNEPYAESDLRYIRPDGSTRWLMLRAEIQRGDDGAPRRFLGVLFDITDRKETEDMLRQSQERLRDITDAVPLLISYTDADQRFRFVNKRYETWFDCPLEEVVGKRVSELMPPPVYAARKPYIERALAGEEVFYDVDMPRPHGIVNTEVMHIPHRAPDGSVLGMYSVVQDITRRKQIEAALRDLNETLERRVEERTAERDRIWQHSNELMAVFEFDGRRKAINPAWSRVLGYDEETLLNIPFAEITHPEDRERLVRSIQDLAEGRLVPHFEDRLRHADGSYRLISWTGVPGDGVFYAIGRDITEERATEEALRQSQKMEAVGQLTGGIAHDFNNLLTGIMGSLDLLQRRIGAGRLEDTRRFLDAAMTSANRAAALTERLLAFGRRQSLDIRPVDLNALVASLEDLFRRTLGETIALQTVEQAGLWTARSDANQLESALLNLVINARDAMPNGGKLTIATSNERLDEAYTRNIDGIEAGDYVALSVSDTGHGMPPEVVRKAFDPFFTTKPIGQGTGLGLSMIYGFARQSGGHVRIHSEVGRGTTVTLYARRDDRPVEQPAPALEKRPEGAGETVLVVEDDAAVRMLILEVLRELGYRTLEAYDSRSALPFIEGDETLDLLVTDVGMPGMNGRDLADLARRGRPDLPVLFVTGYAEGAAIRGGFLDPGMEMITKPFSVDALAVKLRAILDTAGREG